MPKKFRPTPPENHCIDFSPLLRTCGITGLACDYGTTMGCDIYSLIPRKPKLPAPEKPKRDFVKEVMNELDRMNVTYEIDGVIHNNDPNNPRAPEDF